MERKEFVMTLDYEDNEIWHENVFIIKPNLLDRHSKSNYEKRKLGITDEYLFGISDGEEEVESKYQGEYTESVLKKHTGESPGAAASKKREREMQSESAGVAKLSWPEVVGWSGEAAVAQIEKDNGNVVPIVVKVKAEEIASLSEKVRPNIVKIFVDDNGLVIQPPVTG
ncbi:hypothetical protein LguiA_017864 [Lonicera macranthoides]